MPGFTPRVHNASLKRMDCNNMMGSLMPDEMVPDTVAHLRNYHGGLNHTVEGNDLILYPNLRFNFAPVCFDTHQMAYCPESEWKLQIKQKSAMSRPIIRLYSNGNFGFTLRIKARWYFDINDVFREILKTYVIERSMHSNINIVPKLQVQMQYVDRVQIRYVDRHVAIERPVLDVMENESAKVMAGWGDWRPDKPDMNNVIPIEEYLTKVDGQQTLPVVVDPDLEKKIAAL